MAHNEDLAHRVRELIADEPDIGEQKVFGGLAFLITRHMVASARKAWRR